MNSKPCLFTISLVKPSQNKLINETEISFESNWNKKFLKTIETGYAKAPFFQEVFDMLAVLMDNREKNLSKARALTTGQLERYKLYLSQRTKHLVQLLRHLTPAS